MRLLTIALALILTTACGREPIDRRDGGQDAGQDAGTQPSPDDAGPLKLANWNLKYFGDTSMAPTDDALQQSNATAIFRDAGFDIAGLQEVVDASRFNAMVAALPGYDGILSSDSTRVSGTSSCASFSGSPCYGAGEQKLALLYRTSVASVRSAQLILTGTSSVEYDFAYRPPLRVDLDLHLADGGIDPIVVIVLHLKAYADGPSWSRRQASSAALKSYLDDALPTQKVIVLGDWNDDLDHSTAGPSYASPFQNFVSDSARYRFVTDVLTQNNTPTTPYGSPIDHQLVTNELLPQLQPGSVTVVHPEFWGDLNYTPQSQYTSSTSDHWPVVSRWRR